MTEPARIIDVQRRIYEVGRIRLGRKVGEKGRPTRLDTFRFTSRNEPAMGAVAQTYGGKVEEWKDAPGEAKQWEVFTDARELEVIVPPTAMALSQSYEDWTGGVAQRRCDGVREALSDGPCLCAAEMDAGAERKCKPTTRLNLILPALRSVGVWRLESHGYNAAAELAGAAELAQIVAQSGRLHPARLFIDTRTAKRLKRGGGTETRHFVVPVLDLDLPLRDLLPGTPAALEAPALPPEVGRLLTPVDQDALPDVPALSIADQVHELESRRARPRSDAAEPIRPTKSRQRGRESASAPEPVIPPTDDLVPDPDTEPTAAAMVGAARDKAALDRARNIAIAARNAGLDDDGRHHYLEAASGGAYSSGKDVPPEHIAAIMAGLVKLKRGRLELRKTGRGKAARWELIDTETGEKAGPE